MELGIGKRSRKRPSMGKRHRGVLVRVYAFALVALLLSCEAGNVQQQNEREPAFDVDALEEEDVVTAVVPEMAPVEDTARVTDSGSVEDGKYRKTPSISVQLAGGDDLPISSRAAASTRRTGDETREQTIAEETKGVDVVVEVPHKATAAAITAPAAAAAATTSANDADILSSGDFGVGSDEGGATDSNGDSDDAGDVGAGTSRSGDRLGTSLHSPNSEGDLVPAEEDGVHVSAAVAAADDQGTATIADAEIFIDANGKEKVEEEKGQQNEGGGGEEGDEKQQQQQQQEMGTEENLNAPEMANGTKSSSTNPDLDEQARCGTTAASDDDCAEASNDDDNDGPDGINVMPDIEPNDSADDGAPTSSSSGSVGSNGHGDGADETAAAAVTTDQQLPPSEPETGPSVDKEASSFHAPDESAAKDDLPVAAAAAETAASGDDDDAVAGSFDDGEGGTVLGAGPSVASTGHRPADSRGERRQQTKTPSEEKTLADDMLSNDARVSAGHEEPLGMGEGVEVEPAGRGGSMLDGSNGRVGGERYRQRNADDRQGLGTRRPRESDGGGASSDGGGAEAGGGSDAGAEFARPSQEELAQRVRQMEAEVLRKILADEDAKSLLDIWVERAREYVLTRTVPPTDAECDFNWSRLRCEPKCLCGARLRFGDYTPGRTCRLLHRWERSPDCEAAWDPSDEPAVRRLAATLAWGLGSAKRAYEARVAPPSDPECTFDLETRRCQPQSLCRLKFRWGDLTPSDACRLAQEEKPAASAASGAPLFHK